MSKIVFVSSDAIMPLEPSVKGHIYNDVVIVANHVAIINNYVVIFGNCVEIITIAYF